MRITHRQARWVGWLGAHLIRGLGATWRVRVSGCDPIPRLPEIVFAFLHGDMLVPAYIWRRWPSAVMVSGHRDGEVITQVVEHLGRHRAVRGSTTRGGAKAFLEMTQRMEAMPWTITPDGPRGPRGKVHEGVILLASQSGRPILAGGFAVSRGKRFDSWDRFVVPAPFARIAVHVAEPLRVPPDLDRAQRADYARQLEELLENAHREAVGRLASW